MSSLESVQLNALNECIIEFSPRFELFKSEISKVVVGQEQTIHFITLAVLCDGHILLEGVPGVAKTTMVKAATKALGVSFARIQFTPDLLPSDLIGSLIYNQKTQEFETKKGPIFANLVLADEINRAPAKVQAALLEAMQEHQVTIGSNTYRLEEPFLVFATQNPIEQEGTYRLPEAQIDRFTFKLIVGYPSMAHEKEILDREKSLHAPQVIIPKEVIFSARESVRQVHVDDRIANYIVKLVHATRSPKDFGLIKLIPLIQHGASPRASIALMHAAQAHAFLEQRHFVIPEDITFVAKAVLRHRIALTFQAEAQAISTDQLVQIITQTIPMP